MNYLLDTSAIFGMSERRNPRIADVLRTDGNTELPACHPVSLGELASCVQTARLAMDDDALIEREQTLATARLLPVPSDALGQSEVDCFGIIAALTSRKLSHNDQWILASAAAEQAVLVTEDGRQFEASRSAELRDALMHRLGLTLHPATFVG